jgi:Lon protease-like protein
MSELSIPVFPLNTVLFPDGILPLRLFEPRYLDMVSTCMKTGTGFGVCLIHEGNETGTAATIHAIGTLAKIIDWEKHNDGLLGITVCGQQRFAVLSQRVQPDQLIMASVNMLPDEPETGIPQLHLPLVDLLRQTLAQAVHPYSEMPRKYDDASWVSCRLAELLPFKLSFKQELLELNDSVQRLMRISLVLKNLEQESDRT